MLVTLMCGFVLYGRVENGACDPSETYRLDSQVLYGLSHRLFISLFFYIDYYTQIHETQGNTVIRELLYFLVFRDFE
jgi:hypothetical protein